MRKRIKILLIVALCVGFFLRFWRLTSLPYPPDGDEVAFGYYGWSLLHFGADEYGKILPLNFSSIGDFKYPGLAYFNMIPAALFGLSDVTTRFISATSGVALITIVFYFSRLLFASEFLAVTSSWFVALSPWGIIESRLGYESMVATFLVTTGLFLFYKLIRGWKPKRLNLVWLGVFILFILAAFTYAAPRFFLPAFLFLIMIASFIKITPFVKEKRKILFMFLGVSFVIALSLIPLTGRGRAGEDFRKGISTEDRSRLELLYIGAGTSPIRIHPRITWFFHNKYRVAVFDFVERYLEHFSPKFLFFEGEASLQRVPDMGVLLFAQLPLLFFGLLYLLKEDKNHSGKIILAWLLLAPIPSAMTAEAAAINRASLMIVPISILSAFGLFTLRKLLPSVLKKIVTVLVYVGVIFSSLYFANQIFIQKPLDRPWYKQAVNRALTKEILSLKGNYEAVVTSDDDYIFFLFYGKIPPKNFLADSDLEQNKPVKWERVNRWSNIYFKMPYQCPKSGKLKVLYVCAGGDVPQNSKIIKTIYYSDGIPAYSLIEFYPLSQMPSPLPALSENLHYMVDIEKSREYPDGIIPNDFPSFW